MQETQIGIENRQIVTFFCFHYNMHSPLSLLFLRKMLL
jgi:hypothetical protein